MSQPAPAGTGPAEASSGPRIHLTPAALEVIHELLQEEGLLEEGGVRLSASFGAGCSTPLRFNLELDVTDRPGDLVMSGGGIRIFVAEQQGWSLDGLQVDYVDSPGMGEGFAFRHPRGAGGRAC